MSVLDEIRNLPVATDPRIPLIWKARLEGHSWPQIADAFGMSRSGVIKLAKTQKPN